MTAAPATDGSLPTRLHRGTDAAEFTIDVLDSRERVNEIQRDWSDLLASSTCNRAFSSPEWHQAWYAADDVASPYVVVARRRGRLAAVLPLSHTRGNGAVLSPCNWCDYNDVIAAAKDDDAVDAVLKFLLAPDKPFDHIRIRRARNDSALLAGLGRLGLQPNRGLADAVGSRCRYIRLPASYDEYIGGRSKSFRKNLRVAKRRAEQRGIVVRQLEADEFTGESLHREFLQLHLLRFGESSCFAAPLAQSQLRVLLDRLCSAGRLGVFVVVLGDDLQAIDLCMQGNRSYCVWNGGFRAEVEELSPGRLLLDLEIQAALGRDFAEVDLLRGDQDWKLCWATNERTIWNFRIDP